MTHFVLTEVRTDICIEGFARYIENLICRGLDLPENHGGKEQPFNRVVFYEGGAHYIDRLNMRETELTVQIEKLFDRMSAGQAVERANLR